MLGQLGRIRPKSLTSLDAIPGARDRRVGLPPELLAGCYYWQHNRGGGYECAAGDPRWITLVVES